MDEAIKTHKGDSFGLKAALQAMLARSADRTTIAAPAKPMRYLAPR